VGLLEIGLQGDGLPECVDRRGYVAVGSAGEAQVIPGLGVLRVALHRRFECGSRALLVAEAPQRDPEPLVGFGEARTKADGGAKVPGGGLEIAGLAVSEAEAEMRLGKGRLVFDRSPEFAERRLRVAFRETRQALRVVRLSESGLDFQRLVEFRNRVRRPLI